MLFRKYKAQEKMPWLMQNVNGILEFTNDKLNSSQDEKDS